MSALRTCVQYIDAFTDTTGRLLAWLVLVMALVTTAIVVLRYGFNLGSIMTQEAVIYMHGCLFMLGAAYTLKSDGHVRVDIFYRNYSQRGRAWVDGLGGIVLLLPLCVFIGVSSFAYVAESWRMSEISAEAGGIPAVFLLKSLIPLLAINLFFQGLAEILRSALLLTGES